MNEKVQEYLEKKRRKREEISREERASFLLTEGLWEKEYAPDENASRSLYPETDENGRWRRVPLRVTEEEWAEIVRLSGRQSQGGWRAALQIAGILCCLWGGIAGLQAVRWGGDFLPVLLGGALGTVCFGQAAILQALDRR